MIMKVMIIPGNGNTDISDNWFPYVKKGLEVIGIEVIAKKIGFKLIETNQYRYAVLKKVKG